MTFQTVFIVCLAETKGNENVYTTGTLSMVLHINNFLKQAIRLLYTAFSYLKDIPLVKRSVKKWS